MEDRDIRLRIEKRKQVFPDYPLEIEQPVYRMRKRTYDGLDTYFEKIIICILCGEEIKSGHICKEIKEYLERETNEQVVIS